MRYTVVPIAAASMLFSPVAVAAQGTVDRMLTEETLSHRTVPTPSDAISTADR
jgi:NADH:ubiquinone oxidoreductase subunit 2 (subunit N)